MGITGMVKAELQNPEQGHEALWGQSKAATLFNLDAGWRHRTNRIGEMHCWETKPGHCKSAAYTGLCPH